MNELRTPLLLRVVGSLRDASMRIARRTKVIPRGEKYINLSAGRHFPLVKSWYKSMKRCVPMLGVTAACTTFWKLSWRKRQNDQDKHLDSVDRGTLNDDTDNTYKTELRAHIHNTGFLRRPVLQKDLEDNQTRRYEVLCKWERVDGVADALNLRTRETGEVAKKVQCGRIKTCRTITEQN